MDLGAAGGGNPAQASPGQRGADWLTVRGHAQARGLGAGLGRQARCAVARRAHQPPGPGLHCLAGRVADQFQGQLDHHHARPCLFGPGGHQHCGAGPRTAAPLPRQLCAVPGAKRRSDGPGSSGQRQSRQTAGPRRDLDSQGRGSPPHSGGGAHQAPARPARPAFGAPRCRGPGQPGRVHGRPQRQNRGRVGQCQQKL